MKGLIEIPNESSLGTAYARLQGILSAGGAISCQELALWSQWARFDPRLGEQWISWLLRAWRVIAPGELNSQLLRQPWPAAAGALLEQARVFGTFSRQERKAFAHWMGCALSGVRPAEGGLFFIGLRALGGGLMREDARVALEPYRKWGFLGREILFNKAPAGGRTLVPAQVRRSVLDELARTLPRFGVKEYREALGGWVSPRQAELDLKAHPGLRARGRTKGRSYGCR